jgi:hypothetical protein
VVSFIWGHRGARRAFFTCEGVCTQACLRKKCFEPVSAHLHPYFGQCRSSRASPRCIRALGSSGRPSWGPKSDSTWVQASRNGHATRVSAGRPGPSARGQCRCGLGPQARTATPPAPEVVWPSRGVLAGPVALCVCHVRQLQTGPACEVAVQARCKPTNLAQTGSRGPASTK